MSSGLPPIDPKQCPYCAAAPGIPCAHHRDTPPPPAADEATKRLKEIETNVDDNYPRARGDISAYLQAKNDIRFLLSQLAAAQAELEAERQRGRLAIDAGEAYLAAYFAHEDAADRYRSGEGDVPHELTEKVETAGRAYRDALAAYRAARAAGAGEKIAPV